MSTEKLASDTSFSLSSAPEPAICPEAERLVRKQETALGYRIMASWGWGADGSGHITARDPEWTDAFWSLRYGVPFGEARVEDLVLVNELGEVVLDVALVEHPLDQRAGGADLVLGDGVDQRGAEHFVAQGERRSHLQVAHILFTDGIQDRNLGGVGRGQRDGGVGVAQAGGERGLHLVSSRGGGHGEGGGDAHASSGHADHDE